MACNQTYDGSQVFSGGSPTSWTDLDLSSYVGSNRALVYLRVDISSGIASWYKFRTNGLARDIADSTSNMSACCASQISSGNSDYFLVETDDSGIVEWYSGSSQTTSINIIAYEICSVKVKFPSGLSPDAMKMVIEDGC